MGALNGPLHSTINVYLYAPGMKSDLAKHLAPMYAVAHYIYDIGPDEMDDVDDG